MIRLSVGDGKRGGLAKATEESASGAFGLSAHAYRPWAEATAMQQSTEEFVHRQNVVNYIRLLRAAPNLSSRNLLMELLAQEATKARAEGWTPILGVLVTFVQKVTIGNPL